jgi:dihydrodipicolinate reductase
MKMWNHSIKIIQVIAEKATAGEAVLAAALTRPGDPWVGRDAGDLLTNAEEPLHVPISDDHVEALTPDTTYSGTPVDVLIDFSAPAATMQHARHAALMAGNAQHGGKRGAGVCYFLTFKILLEFLEMLKNAKKN